jgi:zinc transport system permease protein
MEFLHALSEHAFLQYALIAGLLASVACGVMGSYVAARRITYVAGGIAHSVLGGMGLARYLQVTAGWEWLDPLYGAVVAALAAAVIIGLVTLRAKESEDTVISAIWAIGMAVGVIFIWKTPGYGENLMSYLFGNILMVTPKSLWLIMVLDVVVVAAGVGAYRQLAAVCFDEEFARLRGVNVEAYYLLLLCLTALTVVLLTMVVGLVMVIALLSLPVAIAGRLTRSLLRMMLVGAVLSALFTTVGLAISYEADLPSGATTIVLAGAAYLLTVAGSGLFRRRPTRTD